MAPCVRGRLGYTTSVADFKKGRPLHATVFAPIAFLREHAVLAVAAVAAVASMVVVPPDSAYWGYFDGKTLGCLFCVLAVASALRLMGAFDRAARAVIARFGSPRSLALALVLTTAALSCVATNDMALIMMLPLSAATLVSAEQTRLIPAVFVLQSLAANLCGMIVPFGNPQNLYLYSYYGLHLGDFLRTMALPFAISVVGVVAATWWLAGRPGRKKASASARATQGIATAKASVSSAPAASAAIGAIGAAAGPPTAPIPRRPMPLSRRRLGAYGVLLALTLLAVFRVLPIAVTVVIVAAALAVLDRRALAAVDWPLLATFACFFVFAGNLARIPELAAWLGPLMDDHGLVISAGASQVISNVPAAVLLSHFTDAWQPLLVGVNIGGAGTLVGSLASLITLQHFTSVRKVFPQTRTMPELSTGRFLGLFALLNVAFLVVLLVVCGLCR